MRTRFEQIHGTRNILEGTVLSAKQKALVEESGRSATEYDFSSYSMLESDASSMGLQNCTLYLLDSTMTMPGHYLHICTGIGNKSKVRCHYLHITWAYNGFTFIISSSSVWTTVKLADYNYKFESRFLCVTFSLKALFCLLKNTLVLLDLSRLLVKLKLFVVYGFGFR